MTIATSTRSVAGTARVVGFNWPKYAAVPVLVAVASVATAAGSPRPVAGFVWAAAGAGALWTVTSLAATWWVYDHRHVDDRIAVGLDHLGDWAGVHAGFDAATPRLAAAIGWAPRGVVELSMHASPSLRRARTRAPRAGGVPGAVDGLPIAASSLDAIFVTFAAHEVRDRADQRALFAELRRVLRPGGRLVVTEHLRDLANFAVYGPGALHFQPAATWIDRGDEAGFDLVSDVAITPFVHRMVWKR